MILMPGAFLRVHPHPMLWRQFSLLYQLHLDVGPDSLRLTPNRDSRRHTPVRYAPFASGLFGFALCPRS
jgi:hypothetical protein